MVETIIGRIIAGEHWSSVGVLLSQAEEVRECSYRALGMVGQIGVRTKYVRRQYCMVFEYFTSNSIPPLHLEIALGISVWTGQKWREIWGTSYF